MFVDVVELILNDKDDKDYIVTFNKPKAKKVQMTREPNMPCILKLDALKMKEPLLLDVGGFYNDKEDPNKVNALFMKAFEKWNVHTLSCKALH